MLRTDQCIASFGTVFTDAAKSRTPVSAEDEFMGAAKMAWTLL